ASRRSVPGRAAPSAMCDSLVPLTSSGSRSSVTVVTWCSRDLRAAEPADRLREHEPARGPLAVQGHAYPRALVPHTQRDPYGVVRGRAQAHVLPAGIEYRRALLLDPVVEARAPQTSRERARLVAEREDADGLPVLVCAEGNPRTEHGTLAIGD